MPKLSEHVLATSAAERICSDIATVKSKEGESKVTRPNWCIMVDERTRLKFSDFFVTKNGMVEPTCEKLQRWKECGKVVKYI